MRFAWERSMEKALKGTESSAFYGRRSRNTAARSSRAERSSSRKSQRNTKSLSLNAISKRYSKRRTSLTVDARSLFLNNFRFLKKIIFPPIFKAICIRMIVFYQKHLSRHTCLYNPTCSEYTKRCINNLGTLPGILLGLWRIIRCNPLSKGGIDPAPENPFKKKWLL